MGMKSGVFMEHAKNNTQLLVLVALVVLVAVAAARGVAVSRSSNNSSIRVAMVVVRTAVIGIITAEAAVVLRVVK